MLPLSTEDKPGFRAMLQKSNPRFQLPTQKHFTKVAILSLASQARDKIEYQIFSRELATTTDLWISVSGDPYITVTCHFISSYWVINTSCL